MAKAVTTLSVNCFPVFLFHLFLFREVENYDHFEILIRCIFRFDITKRHLINKELNKITKVNHFSY